MRGIRLKLASSWVLRATLASLGTLIGSILARLPGWRGWDTAVIIFLPPLLGALSDPALWIPSKVWKRREAILTFGFGFGGVLLSLFQMPWYIITPPLTVGLLTLAVRAFRRWETNQGAAPGIPSAAAGFKLVGFSLYLFAAGAILVGVGFGLFTGLFFRRLDAAIIAAGSFALIVAIVFVAVSLAVFIVGVSLSWRRRDRGNAVLVRVVLASRTLLFVGYGLLFVLGVVTLGWFFNRSVLLAPILEDVVFTLFVITVVPFFLAAVLPVLIPTHGRSNVVAWLGTGLGLAGIAIAMASVLYFPPYPIYPPLGPAVWVSAWFVAAVSAFLLSLSYRSIAAAPIGVTANRPA